MAANSAFISSGDVYLGKLLEFRKACQVPFRVPRGNVGFLWKHCRMKGPPQACRGEFHGLRGVVVGSLGFPSSCIFTCGNGSCLLREFRSPLSLRGATRDSLCSAAGMNSASSRVEAETSGFLSISDIDFVVSAAFEQGSQALS